MTIFELTNRELCRIAQEDWTRSETHYRDLFTFMEEDIKRYWMMSDPSLLPSHAEQKSAQPQVRSNLKLSYARSRIETAVSLMMSAMFAGGDKWLSVSLDHDLLQSDQLKRQLIVELFKQHRLRQLDANNMNLVDSIEGFLLQAALTYWSVGYIGWNRSGGWVRRDQYSPSKESFLKSRMNAALKRLKMSRTKSKNDYDPSSGFVFSDAKHNHPTFNTIHTFNSRPDPEGGRILKLCAFFMDELRVPWHVLRANEFREENPGGSYINLDELWEITKGEDHKTGEEELHQNIGEPAAPPPTKEKDENKENTSFRDTLVLRRYWTEHGYFMTDRDFNVVVKIQATDGWPLFKHCWTYDTTFEAQSAIRLLKNHDTAKDATINLRIDAQAASIFGTRFTDMSRISEDDQGTPMAPGAEIGTLGDPSKITFTDRANEVGQSSLQDIQLIENDGDGLFHINDNTLGRYFSSARLATEVQKVDQNQANYTGQKIEGVERTILSPMLNKITSLELLYIDKDEKLSWFDPKVGHNRVMTLTREEFEMYAAAIRYEAIGSRWVNEHDRMAAGILNAFNSTMGNPATAQVSDPVAIHQLIWKFVGNILDPQDLLNADSRDRFSYDPEHEWLLMQQGISLDTHRNDDNEEHRRVHEQQRIGAEVSGISPSIINLLVQHIEKTDEAIAAMSTTNPTGMMGMAAPGQDLSQFTQGTQGANLGNPQPNNMPPVNTGVL